MKIKKIKLYNFRQFLDLELEFSTDKNKNVTVILAENSTGKTTLMQSLKWCLYGDDETSLDNLNQLLNFYIQNVSNKEKETIFVEVTIEEDGTDYTIRRTREVFRKSNKTHSEIIKIEYRDSQGETHFLEENIRNVSSMQLKKISRMINQILTKEMSRYFLFDGERINNLGSNSSQSKKDIKEAIGAINGFNILDNSILSLKQLDRFFKKSITDNSQNQRIKDISFSIKNIEKDIEATENEIASTSLQIKKNEDTIEKLDEDLIHFKDVESMVNQRLKIESEIKRNETRLEELRESILKENKNYRKRALIFSLYEKYRNIEFQLDYDEKMISNMQSNSIDEIIERGYCICGEKLTPSHLYHLNEQKKYQPPISNAQLIKDFENSIIRESADIDGYVARFESDRKQFIRSIDDNLSKVNELEELTSSIGQSDSSDIKEKNNLRKNLQKELGILESNLRFKKEHINSQINKLKENKEIYNELLLEQHKNNYNRIKLELIIDSLNFLEEKSMLERKKRKEEIEILANKHFNEIIYKKKNITLSSTFEYTVREADGQIASPSEGERIAISMSLILAIIDAHKNSFNQNSQNNSVEYSYSKDFSLILDAAFATLDDDFSQAISQKLPRSIEQVILFSTRRQYNGTVASGLGNHIGKIYSLSIPEIKEMQNAITNDDLQVIT